MSNCNHHCDSCAKACGDKTTKETASGRLDFHEKPHPLSRIRKVIGIVSGKGGVGKSLVTSSLAVAVRRQRKQTAILDADITGPSIPKVFGLHTKAVATDDGILPVKTKTGISVMSINLLLDGEATPVIWRGSHCRHRQAVLDGCYLAGRGCPFCRYAAWNWGRAADRVSIAAC